MNRLTSYRGTLQASASELPIRTDRKLSHHERSMLRLYIAAYKARCDDPYALYADSLRPGRALSNRTRLTARDPAFAAPYGGIGTVHDEVRVTLKARRSGLSYAARQPPSLLAVAKAYYERSVPWPRRGELVENLVQADFAAIEGRVLAHMQYAAPWRRSRRPYIRYNGFDFEVYGA